MVNADSLRQTPSSLPTRAAIRRRGARLGALAVLLAVGLIVLFPGCDEASCPTLDDLDACTIDECQNGTAVHTYLDDGHPCFMGRLEGACTGGFCIVSCATEADCDDGRACTKPLCANGACVLTEPDADDPMNPTDGNVCTHDSCLHGEPFYWPVPENTSCNDGKGECDNGICSSCDPTETASDCGANLECRTWTCQQGTCIHSDFAKGTLLLDDIPGDCLQRICDGYGGVEKIADPADAPTSMNLCLSWICVGWTPVVDVASHLGQPCATSIGMAGVCDGNGACVGCLVDGDCPNPVLDRCYNNICVSCGDNTQNGGETGVDCGGTCGACLGAPCTEDANCASDHCVFTNVQTPEKRCCDAPCDQECRQCSALGACEFVPKNVQDVETCNGSTVACNGSGQCKTTLGHMCAANSECISNYCNTATQVCSLSP